MAKSIKPSAETLVGHEKENTHEGVTDVPKTTFSDLLESIVGGYSENGVEEERKKFAKLIGKYINEDFASLNKIGDKYNIIILFDEGTMIKTDADKIYNAVTKFTSKKPLLLVLLSNGGIPGSAYLIGKLCREYCNNHFTVVVPRYAKSAATLICCAADEIHMGSLSELGPIDPQIDNMPALGLKNAIEHLASLVKENPASSDMFAKYLHYSVQPINLGYYERVAESAKQYAEKLLLTHQANLPRNASDIAEELVYKYKDHGFVIDKIEAEAIFGSKIVRHNTDLYEFGNSVYRTLDWVRTLFDRLGYVFYYIGSFETEPTVLEKRKK